MSLGPALINKYRKKGIIVDANILLLYVIGRYDLRRISTFKRTLKYDVATFEMVRTTLEQFEQRYTTPHVVTEVDNMCGNLHEHEWPAISAVMQTLIPSFIEMYTDSAELVSHPLYPDVGIADCSINAFPDMLIFSDDGPLASRLERMGRDVLRLAYLVFDAT